MVRLQTKMGAERVRRGPYATRPIGPHMEARHSALQQVSCFKYYHTFTRQLQVFASC